MSLIKTVSEKDYFTECVKGIFSYFDMFGFSLLKIEYLAEIEKILLKSEIITCMLETLKPCPFLTEYVSENRRLWEKDILVLASSKGHLEIVKRFLQDSRFNTPTFGNQTIRSALENGQSEILKLLFKD